jgi:hypothetical protein
MWAPETIVLPLAGTIVRDIAYSARQARAHARQEGAHARQAGAQGAVERESRAPWASQRPPPGVPAAATCRAATRRAATGEPPAAGRHLPGRHLPGRHLPVSRERYRSATEMIPRRIANLSSSTRSWKPSFSMMFAR